MGAKMLAVVGILAICGTLCHAVSPLTSEELRQIRDFTAKAHMKRLQNFPDQLMTPSNHYVGRRIPNVEKQPTIFMQAPNGNGGGAQPPQFQIEPQQAGAVQNFLINYPITTNAIAHQQQQQHHHQQQQQAAQQQQIFQQQRPQQQQQALQFVPVQNAGGPPRGPPLPHYKRPSFFSFGGPESAPPTSLLQFFFPKRPARRPPSFRPPLRFEYAQTAHNPVLYQHQQNLRNIMAQQHLLTVQQQQQQGAAGQQTVIQPSTAPITTAQSSTVKTSLGSQATPTVNTQPAAAPVVKPTVTQNAHFNNASPFQHQNQQHFFPIHHSPPPPHFAPNQFHREVPFFGKPIGKPGPPQKFPPVNPAFVPQNRPGDDINYIQKYASPQPDFNFLPLGHNLPPVIAGPTSNRFSSPVSFSHIEQMPFALHQPQQLPMHMVVQSQEFPHYHFTTTFTASNNDGTGPVVPPSNPPHTILNINNQVGDASEKPQQGQQIQVQGPVASFQSSSVRQTHRVKKLRPRPAATEPTTTTPFPTTTQSLGDIIFESAKETREFHDSSSRLAAPTISNVDPVVNVKPRKPKQSKNHHQQEHVGSLQKASVESSSVVLAPLVHTAEYNEPLPTTSSPRPITSTLVSISTISTTTEQPYKPKILKAKGTGEFHFHKSKPINHHPNHHPHHEKRVTASGSGLGAVTVEPLRLTSTGTTATTSSSSSKSTPGGGGGRVVTTSITSRVVSSGPSPNNPNKRYRLRKVKVPNPEAIKANNNKTTTTSSFSSSSSSSSTTNIPSSTTPISTRTPRSTTTISSTESSLSTTSL